MQEFVSRKIFRKDDGRMRKLLNTLYVTSRDAYLSLDGENIVVLKGEDVCGRFPLHNFESIVTFGYTGASPALMGYCARNNISLTFLSNSGRFLARIIGEENGNVLLRKKQYRISDSEQESLIIAKNIILGKLYNSKWMLERTARDHVLRVDVDKFTNVSKSLTSLMHDVKNADNLETLRGIEGTAASQYFSCFDDLILQQKEDFFFVNRNRRPPLDNLNALLSYTYTLLTHEIGAALQSVGLDPYVGFLHRDRPGRMSLALDLVEELRSVYAERFVLTLINRKMIAKTDFSKMENGAILLHDDGRRKLLTQWQSRKQEEIVHPFLNERIPWGLVPYVQAMLLAKYLHGDLDAYPPFMWK